MIHEDFEVHLTISPAAEQPLEKLRAFAGEEQLKITHIILAHGLAPSQPMLTHHCHGTLESTMAGANRLIARLSSMGLSVCRTKIEISATHPAAPSDKVQALTRPLTCYFEHHAKLLLPTGPHPAALTHLTVRHTAHLSLNALRHRPDGMQERFLTQRFYSTGWDQASSAFDALLLDLQQAHFNVLESEAEYILFDSNTELDAGWLDTR